MSLIELIDIKIVRVLSILIRNPDEHYHIQKLSKAAKVPLSSTFRIVNKLAKLGYVEIITVGKFKIYKLSSQKEDELKILGEFK